MHTRPPHAPKRPPFARRKTDWSARPLSVPQAALKVQSGWRGYRSRCETLAKRRAQRASARTTALAARSDAALAARLATYEYRQLSAHCPEADAAKLAAVDETLGGLVGLEALKEYCASVRQDCLARAALGDAPLVRNVLISGNLGVGKKLAASTLCSLLRAIGVAKGMTPTETTLEQMALDVRRDVSCVIVDGLQGIESSKGKVDAILSNYPNHCFVFVGATAQVEALHGAVMHFRKVDPAWLQLPNYTPAQLAAITAARIAERGYALADGLSNADLQSALCATWARDVLALRNAHLAGELVQRAVTHRNRRLPMQRLLASTLSLSSADLGLQAEGLQSLLAERAAVDSEVRALVGMGALKSFLVQMRAKVEFVGRGADPRLLEGCLNVVLTGNPGAGKTTAARLLFRALRAYGLLKNNVFVERNALELKGTHVGWTCPQVKEMVQAALGGCLFLDEAYALSGGGKDGDRGDSFSDEALRTLLTETENNRTSLCVVLAGYREAMDGLMRADPGLVRRFPTVLHLDNYSPAELATIAKQTARSRFGLSFAPGLEAALGRHIARHHEGEIGQHNASLAVSLVEAAITRLAIRCVGVTTPSVGPTPSELRGAHDDKAHDEAAGSSANHTNSSTPTPESASMPASPAPADTATTTTYAASEGSSVDGGSGAPTRLGEAEASTLVPSDFGIEDDEPPRDAAAGSAAAR